MPETDTERRDVADVITDGRNLGHSDDDIASAVLVALLNPSEA